MSGYILKYGNKEDPHPAETLFQAIEALYGYLSTQLRQYGAPLRGDKAWIAVMDEKGNVVPCNRNTATTTLQEFDRVMMFCESEHSGLFAEASAVGKTSYKAECLLRKAKDTPQHRAIIKATREAEQTMGRNLPTVDDPALVWHPGSANPVQILWAAEERIFAYNLLEVIEKRGLKPDEVEQLAGFPPETLWKMMHPTNPLRPKKEEVNTLARILRVKPTELWYDAVKVYLDTGDLWDKYLKEAEHASV